MQKFSHPDEELVEVLGRQAHLAQEDPGRELASKQVEDVAAALRSDLGDQAPRRVANLVGYPATVLGEKSGLRAVGARRSCYRGSSISGIQKCFGFGSAGSMAALENVAGS